MIGTLGDIAFEVSEERIRTFTGYKQSGQASYAEHAIHARKGLLEYTGLKASSADLNIVFDQSLGLDVADEIKALFEIMEGHTAVKLILGGQVQGWDRWVIEGLDVTHEIVNNQGKTIKASVNVKLKEYIANDKQA